MFDILKALHPEGAEAVRAELCKPVLLGKTIRFG
jgi:hypothetical protein